MKMQNNTKYLYYCCVQRGAALILWEGSYYIGYGTIYAELLW